MAPMALRVPERSVLLANQRLDPAVRTEDDMTRSSMGTFSVRWLVLRPLYDRDIYLDGLSWRIDIRTVWDKTAFSRSEP
jgi:hypothetical protein